MALGPIGMQEEGKTTEKNRKRRKQGLQEERKNTERR